MEVLWLSEISGVTGDEFFFGVDYLFGLGSVFIGQVQVLSLIRLLLLGCFCAWASFYVSLVVSFHLDLIYLLRCCVPLGLENFCLAFI